MFPCIPRHLFSYQAGLQAPPEIIGPVPEGARANFYITGGSFRGDGFNGTIRAAGADWFTVRPDGVGELDVRATFETDDGALVYVHYIGYGDLGADGYAKFLDGDLPAKLPLRCMPVMRTAHPKYQWLQRLPCVSIGEADLEQFTVSYDVYALR